MAGPEATQFDIEGGPRVVLRFLIPPALVIRCDQGATSVGAWRIVSESGAEVAACDKAQRSL